MFNNDLNDRKNRLNWLKSGIFGILFGAILTSIFILFFNEISFSHKGETVSAETSESAQAERSQTVYHTNVYTAITAAVEKVSGAVVGVSNIKENIFYSDPMQTGAGSGVIYKKANGKAFVITNHHVIEGAQKLEVTLSDGTKEPAKLVGSDIFTDLAILEINAEHVKTVATLGSSENLKLGEPVIAIGNPLGQQFSGSVTQGIISGKERSIPIDLDKDGRPDWQADVIQTDAAINPGNSGGALVNIKGEVIGINSMKIAQAAVEGIGLAIPTSVVKPIIKDLEIYHEVQRPFMGVGLEPLAAISSFHLQETLHLPEQVKSGVAILNVVPGSPADKAGLQRLDVIVALDGKKIENDIDIRKYLYNKKDIGDVMEVTFYRGSTKETVQLSLNLQNSY